MRPERVQAEELTPGMCVRVKIDDCCVRGTWISCVADVRFGEDGTVTEIVWVNGVSLSAHKGATFIPQEDARI